MSETQKPLRKTSAKKTTTKPQKKTAIKKTVSKKMTSTKPTSKKAIKTQDNTLTITQSEKEENILLNQPMQEDSITENNIKEETVVSEKMGFFKLYFSTWKKMFSTKGRASRTEIFLFPIVNLFIFFSFFLSSLAVSFFFEEELISLALITIPYILAIISLPASITLLIRRFHDFSKRALFAVLPYLLFLTLAPLIIFLLNQITPNEILISLSIAVIVILWLWALIWTLMYMFRPGTKGANKYGERPQTKTRIIWINLIIVLINVVLYYGILVFSFLLAYIEMPSDLQTINQNVYESMPYSNSISNVDSGATPPLSDEEFEAEILKMEKFINSLPDENNLTDIEKTETKSPTTTKNLLDPKE